MIKNPVGYKLFFLSWLIVLPFLTLTLAQDYLRASHYVMDDAMIAFRYAENLASTGKIEWNIGETHPTEGFSSLSWIVILALAKVLGLELLTFSRIFSLLCLIAAVLLVQYLVARMPLTNHTASVKHQIASMAFTGILFFANRNLFAHALSGMETAFALLTMTILMTMLFVTVAEISDLSMTSKVHLTKRLRLISVLGFFAILVRPEFGLLIGLFFLAIPLLLEESSSKKRHMADIYIPFILLFLVYLTARIYFYGLHLPLPFYIKVNNTRLDGIAPTFEFIAQIVTIILMCLVLFLTRTYRMPTGYVLCILLAFLFFWIFPTHLMGYGQRFLIPAWGTFVMLAGLCFRVMLAKSQNKYPIVVLITLVSATNIMFVSWSTQKVINFSPFSINSKMLQQGLESYGLGIEKAHKRLGLSLFQYHPKGTLAMTDTGAVPLYSKWNVIDIHGLNNRKVALERYRGKDPNPSILASRPDVIILISTDCKGSPLAMWENSLFELIGEKGYKSIGFVEFYANSYYLNVFVPNNNSGERLSDFLNKKKLFSACISNP